MACALALPAACATTPRASLDEDRAALLRLHEDARRAHLEDDADLLVASQADSMVSLSDGRVSVNRREPTRAMFDRYFRAVTFEAWDDIAPPRIRISPDGRMAWVVVQKRVHVTGPDSTGAPRQERVRYAWLSVYEKLDGRWRLVGIASTDRPDAP